MKPTLFYLVKLVSIKWNLCVPPIQSLISMFYYLIKSVFLRISTTMDTPKKKRFFPILLLWLHNDHLVINYRHLAMRLEVSVKSLFYLVIHEVSEYLRILKIYRTVLPYGRSLSIITLVPRKPRKKKWELQVSDTTQMASGAAPGSVATLRKH